MTLHQFQTLQAQHKTDAKPIPAIFDGLLQVEIIGFGGDDGQQCFIKCLAGSRWAHYEFLETL